MPSRDHQILMALQLDRWSQGRPLRAHEIERELAAKKSPRIVRRWRKFLLSPFWRRTQA